MENRPTNPLAKHFRQPAIYLPLPSKGRFYPDGALAMPANGEVPIYPLTSRDEVTLRTPDSLINGNSVSEVIQSCVPAIKDAWQVPSVDLDAIFIAIRIASYGHKMELSVACPKCKEVNEYEIDLRNTLASIESPDFTDLVLVDNLKVKLKPQAYESANKVNSLRFEEQRMMEQLSKTDVPQEVRLETLKQQMHKIAGLNLEVLADVTEYIQTEDNTLVDNKDFINEFYQNADVNIIKAIEAKLTEYTVKSGAKPEHIKCGSCEHEFKTAVEFDYSNFFAQGS